MCKPTDPICYIKSGAHAVGQAAARSYDATLGPLGYALRQAPGELGHRFLKGVDATGSAYERTINLVPGAGETVGQVVTQIPVIVRDVTVPVGQGAGGLLQGGGDLLAGGGSGLASTGQGVGDFGKWAGIGAAALLVVVAIVALVVLARKGGVRRLAA